MSTTFAPGTNGRCSPFDASSIEEKKPAQCWRKGRNLVWSFLWFLEFVGRETGLGFVQGLQWLSKVMSPKAGQRKLPQSKPTSSMDMRRRRTDGAESHGPDEQRGGAGPSAAEQRGGAGPAAAEQCGGAGPAAAEQRSGAGEPAAGNSGGMGPNVEETAIIGQELVPVGGVLEVGKSSEEQLQLRAVPEGFKTPETQRPVRSPEQLQLENKTELKTNEDSEGKGEKEEKGQVVAVPNGPPVSYGPQSAASMPLFTPEQIAQFNDPRNSTSLLPMTRESVMAPEFPRLLGSFMAYFLGMNTFMKYGNVTWSGAHIWSECLSSLDFNCAHPKMRISV